MIYFHLTLRFLHFIGLASLLGGLFSQTKSSVKNVSPGMFHGALTQLVTGLLLVGISEPLVNHGKISVKLLILAVILLLLGKYRKKTLPPTMYKTVMLLTLLEVAIAVFWR